MTSSGLRALLGARPAPSSMRPVPLYWWSGAAPERARLSHHLDRLRSLGLGGTIIAYAHLPAGEVDSVGIQPLTAEWWELLRWFCSESEERGLTTGICDYNLIADALIDAGPERPTGFGSLVHQCIEVPPRGQHVEVPAVDTALVAAVAVFDNGSRAVWPADQLRERVTDAPASLAHVCLVSLAEPRIRSVVGTFDPTAEDACPRIIDTFYEPFSRELGVHFGRTFTTMFQDELDFGAEYPLWSPAIRSRLEQIGIRDPLAQLPLLWHDAPDSHEFRLSFKDVCASLLEERYFRPVFDWHDSNGVALVMDQISRGDLRAGQRLYVDYASTMRWFHSPGNDDPDLQGPRSIAAFKISSSIARLNGRRRVWNEAHYGSGWGVTPADIIRGLNVGYAAGATYYNPHAVFYTTNESWWEWASPDFALRPPWAEHSRGLWAYAGRCCELLEGTCSRAAVAVLDVSDDVAASAGETTSPELAAQLLQHLPQHGVDLDVLDAASLRAAVVEAGELRVADQSYSVLVLPWLRSIRSTTATLIAEFVSGGGRVLALGTAPDIAGTTTTLDVPVLQTADAWTDAIAPLVADALLSGDSRLVRVVGGSAMVNRRQSQDGEAFYWVTCLAPDSGMLSLRVAGIRPASVWDPLHQRDVPCHVTTSADGSHRVSFPAADGLAYLVLPFTTDDATAPPPDDTWDVAWTAPDVWQVGIAARLDNRFADFAPSTQMEVTAQARIVTSSCGGTTEELRAGDRIYWAALGPPTDPSERDEVPQGPIAGLVPYVMSLAAGVPGDPTLLSHLTGPHGLKGRCPDEFLLTAAVDPDDREGDYWFLTHVLCPEPGRYWLHTGSRSPLAVWLDGVRVVDTPGTAAESFPPWGLPNLESPGHVTAVDLPAGPVSLAVRLTREADQAARAYAVVAPTADIPIPDKAGALRWWAGADPALPITASAWIARQESQLSAAVPPMAIGARLAMSGDLRVRLDGAQLALQPLDPGVREARFAPSSSPEPRRLTVELPATSPAQLGDGLVGPIEWVITDRGTTTLKAWRDMGLGDFSGVLSYETDMVLDAQGGERYVLDLGELLGAARVHVNGTVVGDLITSPWSIDLTDHVAPGRNRLRVDISSGLAEHYRTLPSPYARASQEGTGLIGPVRLLRA